MEIHRWSMVEAAWAPLSNGEPGHVLHIVHGCVTAGPPCPRHHANSTSLSTQRPPPPPPPPTHTNHNPCSHIIHEPSRPEKKKKKDYFFLLHYATNKISQRLG